MKSDYPVVWLRPRASHTGHGRINPTEGRMNTAACPSPNQRRFADSRQAERRIDKHYGEPQRPARKFPARWTRYTTR